MKTQIQTDRTISRKYNRLVFNKRAMMALYRSPVSNGLLLCHDQPPYYVTATWVLKLLIGKKVSTELWVLRFLKRRYLKAFLSVTMVKLQVRNTLVKFY